jgi:hypothetical protein
VQERVGRSKVTNRDKHLKRNSSWQYEFAIPDRHQKIKAAQKIWVTNSLRTADIKNEDPEIRAAASTIREALACHCIKYR